MSFVPWLDFWRGFWGWPNPSPACKPKTCNLDELAGALSEYLESARDVAASATKNVEDAEQLMRALSDLIERKKRGGQSLN